MERKYELTDKTKVVTVGGKERTLHRIKAVRSFGSVDADVEAGDLGGWIEGEKNLSHEGRAWVFDDACVFDDAMIADDALVFDNALVYGNARVGDGAILRGHAKVYGHANIWGYTRILDFAQIFDHANVDNSTVRDQSAIYERAKISNATVCANSKIHGAADIHDYASFYDADVFNSDGYAHLTIYKENFTFYRNIFGNVEMEGDPNKLHRSEERHILEEFSNLWKKSRRG